MKNKTNLGSKLSRNEMKKVVGGKYPGCAEINQAGTAYQYGCCAGLYACGGPHGNLCIPTEQCI